VTRHLSGLAGLAHEYDGFIVDLWGCVHDGLAPYPGAIDCLRRLQAAGKRVVLLSNAPRRSRLAREQLRAMGLADNEYSAILTSGEATRSALIAPRSDPRLVGLGSVALHIGPPRDRSIFEDTGLALVDDPARAGFVVVTGLPEDTGTDEPVGDAESLTPLLRDCVARGLLMICANPDIEIVRGGRRILCAGLIARRYELLGGRVVDFGKPYPEVYREVETMLAGIARARILAVGDALATDIAGARAAGIDSAWVLGGIHAEFLGGDTALAEREASGAGLHPVATVPALVW